MVLQVSTADAAHVTQDKSGTITIQSWIHAYPSENVLSATDSDCFKITGAIVDQGGDPLWNNDSQFTAPAQMTGAAAVAAASKECGQIVPSGGVVFVPPPSKGQYGLAQYSLTTFFAIFTVFGQKGEINVIYSGTYNFSGSPVTVGSVTVPEGQSGPQCTWVITGGNGAYAGLQGNGTCAANLANTYPYVEHTSTGQVWWTNRS